MIYSFSKIGVDGCKPNKQHAVIESNFKPGKYKEYLHIISTYDCNLSSNLGS